MRHFLVVLLSACAASVVHADSLAVDALGLVPSPQKICLSDGFAACAVTNAQKLVRDDALPKEGYRLRVTPEAVEITSSDAVGLFYARQTLRQLVTPRGIPCVTIEDAPAFGWRGLHLDESRHFFGVAVVKRMLDRMAEHKLNVFHWHLTDSHAWRLEIKAFPKLTKEGAMVRVWSANDRYYRVPPGTKAGARLGPDFYTQEQIREIVAYAAARHITVVPEIDFPAHSMMTMVCYPELCCDVKAADGFKPSDQDVCPAADFTYTFFERVFDEVCALFPSEYIHIGGDEASMQNWKRCPRCQALVRREKLADDGPALQYRITRHFADYLARKGRKVIGWGEIAKGGTPPPNAAVMSWQGVKLGMPCVLAPAGYFYFDYEQDLPGDKMPYYYWGWATSLERVYSFDGVSTMTPDEQKLVLGGEATNWTEMTLDEHELEWKLWPRACAVAELWWTNPPRKRDFKAFARRVEVDRTRLLSQGVNCAPVSTITTRSQR